MGKTAETNELKKNRRQKAESSRQKAVGRRQKAERRRQKAEHSRQEKTIESRWRNLCYVDIEI